MAKLWFAGIAVALAFIFTAARCAVDVRLGVDPASDAASNPSDGGPDTSDGP